MFLIFKKKNILLLFISVIIITAILTIYFSVVLAFITPNLAPMIVIDAGHGGVDVKLWQY